MPAVNVNQNRIYYTASESRRPPMLLWLHGSGGSHEHRAESL